MGLCISSHLLLQRQLQKRLSLSEGRGKLPDEDRYDGLNVFLFVCFLRQGFSVALEPVLKLALVVQSWPRTHRDPSSSAY